MAFTRTGNFPIGFRRTGAAWQKDLQRLIDFAKGHGFMSLDLPALPLEELRQVTAAGLRLGSVDLKTPWQELMSADEGKRRAAAEASATYVREVVEATECRNFFVVLLPEDPARPRGENFKLAVDGYGRLCEAIKPVGARIVIEGWPGSAPHYPALACTPEGCRAILKELPQGTAGINFDPSHLIRVGIDSVRFLQEFVQHVFHVHAKDTELLDDDLYEFGNLQPATFASAHRFGAFAWRYCIPGRGVARWDKLLSTLQQHGYAGGLSIELEDEYFLGPNENDQRGLIAARDFLVHV